MVLEVLFTAMIEFMVYVVFYSIGAATIRGFSLNHHQPPWIINKTTLTDDQQARWFYPCVLVGLLVILTLLFIFWPRF